MKEKFKLRHLDVFVTESKDRDLSILMRDVLGYKNSFFNKWKWFIKNFNKIQSIVKEIEEINYEDIKINKESVVKVPVNIDHISYMAMLELQGALSRPNDLNLSEHIAKVISTCTYEENRLSEFSSLSKSFKNYQEFILNQPMFDMIGLFNWIKESAEKSSEEWQKRFLSVKVTDKYLDDNGGEGLNQFNVINTIKSTCRDFNVSEKEAWQISYNLIQSNSYSKAYEGWVQNNIRIAKEKEIEEQRLANKKKYR